MAWTAADHGGVPSRRLAETQDSRVCPGVRAARGLYEDLVRHLREWEKLSGSTPVDGSALVLNHQHRTAPHARNPEPYGRPEFLAGQTEPTVTTLDLFEAWREEDADAIRQLLFGTLNLPVPGPKPPTKGIEPADLKRGWFIELSIDGGAECPWHPSRLWCCWVITVSCCRH